MCAKMSSFSPDSLLLPHRVWKVKFVGKFLCISVELICLGEGAWGIASWASTWVSHAEDESSHPPGAVSAGGVGWPVCCWFSFLPGESVDDCGGGYSESIAEICEELQNGLTPLLIVTPNGRDESGANRDCYLLNPATRAPVHCSMFRFLGGPQLFVILLWRACTMIKLVWHRLSISRPKWVL